MWQGLINRYRNFLPVNENTPIITLNEGNTLLIKADNLKDKLNLGIDLYLKFEGQNPTGSFKDRGMTMAVSKALEEGSSAIVCASTGNTSAAAAAYAARAGMKCFVLLPQNAVALGKLAQALAYGARVLAIDGNFDDALEMVKVINTNHPITLVNSINPYRIEGQKTAAFEVCDQLGDAPDYLAIPVGNAGNITAYWKGFLEYKNKNLSKNLPKMLGFQAAGSAPIVRNKVVKNPETIATAIRIGNPASWQKAVEARDQSGGLIDSVTDEEILAAYKLLASTEGIFAEPASAASIAGVIKLVNQNYFPEGSSIVCVLTGNGLKDPDQAIAISDRIKEVPAHYETIVEELMR